MAVTDKSRGVLTGTGPPWAPPRTPASLVQSLFIILINGMFYNHVFFFFCTLILQHLLISTTMSTLSQYVNNATG